MAEIIAEKIYKSYIVDGEKIDVISDFNYSFTGGKMYCLWGKSGSGKSTLLKILGLLSDPTSGSIVYDSKELYNIRERSDYLKYNIGWVLQNGNIIDNLSVVDNLQIGFPGRVGRDKVEQVLGYVGLEKAAHKNGKHLSGGESQRLAFARAILKNPKIIILDEFTSGLDVESENNIIEITRRHTDMGALTLVASHSDKVKAVSDYVLEVS